MIQDPSLPGGSSNLKSAGLNHFSRWFRLSQKGLIEIRINIKDPEPFFFFHWCISTEAQHGNTVSSNIWCYICILSESSAFNIVFDWNDNSKILPQKDLTVSSLHSLEPARFQWALNSTWLCRLHQMQGAVLYPCSSTDTWHHSCFQKHGEGGWGVVACGWKLAVYPSLIVVLKRFSISCNSRSRFSTFLLPLSN